MATDFSRSAALGFESGKGAGQVNPLATFISGITKKFQERQTANQEIDQQVALERVKSQILSESPLGKAKIGALEAQTDVARASIGQTVSQKQKFLRQLEKDATDLAFKESGGGLMVGIGKKKEEFIRRRKEIFEELKGRHGLTGLTDINLSLPEQIENLDLGGENF